MLQYWLMKAEPDSRTENGVDVAFPIEKFQEVGVTQWDGVRSHEAKKIMKEKQKMGDQVLFYHSNCKLPGIAGLAEICREGYPDHTAWDEKHPYFDAKTDQDKPTWFMVDVEFKSRLANFVPLKLLQHLASVSEPPEEIDYLTAQHIEAIKAMALLNRGRLSVQPVSSDAFNAVRLLGERGGFDSFLKAKGKKVTKAGSSASDPGPGDKANTEAPAPTGQARTRKKRDQAEEQAEGGRLKKSRTKRS